MGCLKIHLLGPFLVSLDHQQITQFDTEKTRALLAYLASEPDRPHQREFLAEMFWPERPKGVARANLRHSLGYLRVLFGDRIPSSGATTLPPFLLGTWATIQLNQASSVWVDTTVFTELLTDTTTKAGLRIDQLEQAVELYRGSFLEGMMVGDSPGFQEWVLLKREGFFQDILTALRQLIDCYRLWGKYEKAIRYARRQVELAPWNEEANQNVMRLLALTGQRAAALAQFETCRRLLMEELGVDPGVETIQLYQQIRDGKLAELKVSPTLIGEIEVGLQSPRFLQEVKEEVEPPHIVAREAELARLDGFLQQALLGQARLVFITGVAGQGKTALLSEFARRAIAARSDLLVAMGNCNAFSGVGDPYLPFRDVLAMLTGDEGSQWSSGTISRKHMQRLWGALPTTIYTLLNRGDSLIGAFLDGKDLFSRAALSLPDNIQCLEQLHKLIEQRSTAANKLEQTFLFEHYTNFVLSLSKQYPLVFILDDLQWADSASVGLLFHLGRRLATIQGRVMIVCAYRPEEVTVDRAGDRHSLVKVLHEFKRIFGDSSINLDQSEERDGRRLVDALLDTEPNKFKQEFRGTLFQHTQGHPLFTVELLRAMQDRGDVFQDNSGDWIEASTLNWQVLPARVQAVIEERIERLTPEQQQILATASVEGEVFTAQVIAEVQKVAQKPLLGQLVRELERQHRLVKELGEFPTGQGRVMRYRFRHSLFQEYIYNRLGIGERRLLHRDVAEAMENLYQGQHDEMAVQLAHHFYQAGENNKAIKYSILAARRAARLYASDETVEHATLAIEMSAEISTNKVVRINLYRDRGLAYEALGKFNQAFSDLEITSQIAHAGNESQLECTALIDLGRLWASRDYHQSYGYYEQALKLARKINDPAILASSLNWMGNWYANAEKPKDAIAYHHEALEMLTVSGNQQELARTLDLLGIASLLGADSISSKRYFDQAIDLFRQLDDRSSLASSLTGRGNIGGAAYISLAMSPVVKACEARRDFEEAIHIACEIGFPAAEAWADWSLGLLEIVQGEYGNAFEVIQRGFHIAAGIKHREWVVGNQSALGVLYLELFALEEAQRHLEQAIILAEELRSQHWINQATGALTEVYLLQNDISQAQNTIEKVISPQMPMDSMLKRYCWVRRAELALAQGDPVLALEITDRLIGSASSVAPGRVVTFLWKLKAEALAVMGQLEEACSLLCLALENAQENDERFLLWRIHASLGKLYASMNCQVSSGEELSMARTLIEELASTLRDEKLKQNFKAFACNTLQSTG
jgi:adenylate cyclase